MTSQLCGGNWCDDIGQDTEDWVQCPVCKEWQHFTCAGIYGKQYYDFICDECAC